MGTDPRVLAVVAFLALLGLIAVVRGTRREVHAARRALDTGTASVSRAAEALATAVAIVGVQALVVTTLSPRNVVFWVALGLPALAASYTLTLAFMVPPVMRRGGGRR